MKVLMYGWEFPPHISGGLGIACYGIVHGLVANHVKVTLVLPQGMWDPAAENNPDLQILNYHTINARIDIKRVDSLIKPYMSAGAYQQSRQKILLSECEYGDDLMLEVARYAAAAGNCCNNRS